MLSNDIYIYIQIIKILKIDFLRIICSWPWRLAKAMALQFSASLLQADHCFHFSWIRMAETKFKTNRKLLEFKLEKKKNWNHPSKELENFKTLVISHLDGDQIARTGFIGNLGRNRWITWKIPKWSFVGKVRELLLWRRRNPRELRTTTPWVIHFP